MMSSASVPHGGPTVRVSIILYGEKTIDGVCPTRIVSTSFRAHKSDAKKELGAFVLRTDHLNYDRIGTEDAPSKSYADGSGDHGYLCPDLRSALYLAVQTAQVDTCGECGEFFTVKAAPLDR